jgi:chromosome segregation ATPase
MMKVETMESPNWLAENWETLTTAVLGAGTTIVAWVQGQKAAKSADIDNAGKIIEHWERLSNRHESRLNDLELKHDECEATKDALSCQVRDLSHDIKVVKQETIDCDRRFNELSTEMIHLKAYVKERMGFPTKKTPNNGGASN